MVRTGTQSLALSAAALLSLTFTASARAVFPGEDDKPSAEAVTKARKAVEAHLARLQGTNAQVQQIEDAAVGRSFPRTLFFAVLFRQYPVARLLPEGLKASSVFAVGPDGKVKVLGEARELEAFFRANLAPATGDAALQAAARAWVRLSQELHQDGFYQFAPADEATKVTAGPDGKQATAKAVVMRGGNGEIRATLTFDREGKLTKVTEEAKLRPGPRPICQATKLLDADPVVRRMAEQDLLIMGRAAKPYLDEQRAKAPPALREAIDRLWERIQAEDR